MRMFIIAAALALIAAPVASANTSQSSRGKAAVEQQTMMLKLAQNQDTKQRSQQYNNQYNKQDTTKRKSWGGG